MQFLSIMDKTFFLRLLVLLLPITFLFSSCDELEELFGMNTVTVTPNKLQFGNKASCDTVVVNCNGVWRVTARPDWVTVSSTDGMDGDELIISVSENLSDKSRRAKILLECGNASDSISIVQQSLNESLKFSYQEDFVDSLDAIYCEEEGIIALFGFKQVEVAPEYFTEERVIYIGTVENKEFVANDAIVIVADSTNFPVRMASKDFNVIFSKIDETHFNCAVYTSQTGEWKEFDNLLYECSDMKRTYTRAMATDGYSDFGLDDALTVVSVANSLKNGYSSALKKDQLGVLEANLGVIGSLQNKSDELGLGIGLATAGSWPVALLTISQYLTGKYDDFVVAQLGKVQISIENIHQINANSCEISYWVNGLNDKGMINSCLYIDVFSYTNWKVIRNILPSQNGFNTIILNDLVCGQYGAFMGLYSTKYPFVNYRTNPLVLFSLFDIGLDKYEIEENPQYEDGAVNFKMNIFLKGNEDGLKDIQQFGYYTKYANAIPDYKEVKNISSIFESTPLTYELLIPRDGFSDETINYTTFHAKPSIDYYIGVYVVLKNGEIAHFDEQIIENLIYEEKPEVITLDAVTVSQNEATLKCEFDNCLFWGGERGIEYTDGSSNDYLLLGVTKEDGICEFQLTDLKPNTNYKYRAYYEINEKKMYGEQGTFTTEESEGCTDGNHVHAVDLGLSVKWACCNVGAGSPEGYGSYFAWGETELKSNYSWSTYKHCNNGSSSKLTKYNVGSSWGTIDNITTLELEDDAAHVSWGGAWRMPTYNDWDELKNNCAWTWTTLNGVKGYKVVSKSNGNSIFLPAAGCRYKSDVCDAGSDGYYWYSSLDSGIPGVEYYLGFDSDNVYWYECICRYCGHPVRAVCP